MTYSKSGKQKANRRIDPQAIIDYYTVQNILLSFTAEHHPWKEGTDLCCHIPDIDINKFLMEVNKSDP